VQSIPGPESLITPNAYLENLILEDSTVIPSASFRSEVMNSPPSSPPSPSHSLICCSTTANYLDLESGHSGSVISMDDVHGATYSEAEAPTLVLPPQS
jgi:hypothetical protein